MNLFCSCFQNRAFWWLAMYVRGYYSFIILLKTSNLVSRISIIYWSLISLEVKRVRSWLCQSVYIEIINTITFNLHGHVKPFPKIILNNILLSKVIIPEFVRYPMNMTEEKETKLIIWPICMCMCVVCVCFQEDS